jgi:hypothetical protein
VAELPVRIGIGIGIGIVVLILVVIRLPGHQQQSDDATSCTAATLAQKQGAAKNIKGGHVAARQRLYVRLPAYLGKSI